MPSTNNMDITIAGIPALKAWARKKPKDADREIRAASRNVGFLVQREARRNAPYRRGDLERSIIFEVIEGGVRIYVPTNSAAGKYGNFTHNGAYVPGPGTRAKGFRAGRKYITRAVSGNTGKINSFYQAAIDKI